MRTFILSTLFATTLFFSTFAQTSPTRFNGCPSVNVAVIRSGNNADITNPFSIYKLNPGNANPSLVSGPILDPANNSVNLQINGVGLNSADGYLYGLFAGIPTIPFAIPVVPLFPFYRIGENAVAEKLGTIAGPSTIAPENASVVNPAAGEIAAGNYYFTAATGVAVPNFANPSASTFNLTRLFIGRITGVASLSAGNSPLSPAYVAISNPSGDASAYLASLYTSNTLATAQNTGLRDLVFNEMDNELYTYVTFPVGGVYFGQMLKVDPTTGILSALAAPVALPFASASNEVAGISKSVNGNILILFTNGDIYRADRLPQKVYDGSITLFNSSTGFPTTLRGDLASCSAADNGPLPVILSDFNAYKQNTGVVINWKTASEINLNKFILQTSTNGLSWVTVSEIKPKGSANGSVYQLVDNNNLNNPIYYRLAMIDMNGSITYSRVKRISSTNSSFDFSVYPNPVKDVLTIESGRAFTSKSNVILIDAMGKSYRTSSKKIAENILKIDLSNFNKGVYYIHITNENGTIASERIIKL